MSKETMTAIIGIRVYPSWKKRMMEEAKEKGKSLSQYLYDLIENGLAKTAERNVKREIDNKAVNVTLRS